MQFKLLVFNVQDFFLPLAYPLKARDLATLTEMEWQLLAAPDESVKPLAKVREIARIIRELDPDLVCLTEMGGQKALELFGELFLEGSYEPFLIEAQSERGIQNGFLLKRDSVWQGSIKSHKDWPVPFTHLHEDDPEAHPLAVAAAPYQGLGIPSERRMSRDVPALFIKQGPKAKKPSLIVLLAHLKSGFDQIGIDPEGRVRRAAELKALVRLYKKLDADHGVPIIVAGDFNGRAARSETAEEFLPLYSETDLEDALELAGRPAHERLSQFSFTRAGIIAGQLDYIFMPKSLQKKLKASETYVYRYKFSGSENQANCNPEIMFPVSYRERNLLPSDHYPIMATLDL